MLMVEKLSYLPNLIVTVVSKGIDVCSNSALKKSWLLRYNAEFGAQVAEPQRGNVHAINHNLPCRGFHEAEECLNKGGLACHKQAKFWT